MLMDDCFPVLIASDHRWVTGDGAILRRSSWAM